MLTAFLFRFLLRRQTLFDRYSFLPLDVDYAMDAAVARHGDVNEVGPRI
jgi:hypothetical protein